MPETLRILTLATLFPNPAQPHLGVFVARQTAALAARADVEVVVVNPIALPPYPLSRMPRHRPLAELPSRAEWDGLEVHRPPYLSVPFAPVFSPFTMARAVRPIIERLHEEKPFDLIDAEFFWPDGPVARRIAGELGLPFTVKARGFDIHYWADRSGCAGAIANAADDAAALFAVSGALRDDMVARGMEAAKITVHHTGVDHALFRPRDREAAKAKLGLSGHVICSIGALIERKRHHLLIDALVQLPNVTLVLIGEGPEEDALRERAQVARVADRVDFAGAMPQARIADHLAAADAMALVSAGEGLANAWVEALAAGTPVIASDVGGVRDIVTSPKAGRIVEPDPTSVARAARAIFAHPPAREEVAAHVADFSWEANAAKLEARFHEIVGK